MTTITLPRAVVEQALEALESVYGDSCDALHALRTALAQQAEPVESALQAVAEKIGDQCAVWYGIGARDVEAVLREAARYGLVHGAQAKPVEPVAWRYQDARGNYRYRGYVQGFDKEYSLLKPVPLYTAPPQQAEPLTIERLRDALVASRIIPPAAVEDPDEYDDGVTLYRIEALHRRIT